MKKILFILLIFNLGFCAWLYTLPTHDTTFNFLYNLSYGLLFLVAAVTSFRLARICSVHRPIHLALGLGALSFTLGQISWFVYNFYLKTDVPYPGLPDAFFMGFYIFAALGGILIMKQSIDIKFSWGQLIEIFITTGVIFHIINSFIRSAAPQEATPLLTQLLNYSYPFFDSLLIVLTLTAIRSKLGKLQPLLLYFMLGFMTLGFADTLFTYQTSLGTYWNGNFVDALFSIGGFFFALGVIYLPNLLHANDSSFVLKNKFTKIKN